MPGKLRKEPMWHIYGDLLINDQEKLHVAQFIRAHSSAQAKKVVMQRLRDRYPKSQIRFTELTVERVAGA